MTAPGVIEKYGVPPERIVDYLTLIGDSSDNVPGIPKVGPKTAVKWLGEHGSLDEIVAVADSFTGKVGEYLRENLGQVPLSKRLVTLKTDVQLAIRPEQLLRTEQDESKLKAHFQRWGFRSWLPEITGEQSAAPAGVRGNGGAENYTTIYTVKQLDRWLDKLAAAGLFSLDTETTGLDYMQAELVGLSFSVKAGEAAYVPLAHDYPRGAKTNITKKALEKLRPLLESEKNKKVGQNLKYDKNMLANYGIELNGIAHDSMLQSYVLNSTGSRHDMDSLAEKYLGKTTTHYEDIAGKGARQIPFNQAPVDKATAYAAEDADITLQLHQALWPKLAGDPGLKNLYTQIEMPCWAS